MEHCRDTRAELVNLIAGRLSPHAREHVEGHLAECSACADEYQLVRMTWSVLPEDVEVVPPAAVRERVLAYAEKQAAALASVTTASEWRRVAPAMAIGFAVAIAVVQLVRLRGAIAPLSEQTVAVLSLSFAALAAVVAGGVFRSRLPRATRSILMGAVGSLGGYLLLTLVLPATDTVHICGDLVFGSVGLSLGQLCSVYLFVTVFYAAIPMATVAYATGGTRPGRRGVMEAAVFALLTAPLLLLQAGFDIWLVPLTVVLGFAGGAVMGELVGHRARLWVLETS